MRLSSSPLGRGEIVLVRYLLRLRSSLHRAPINSGLLVGGEPDIVRRPQAYSRYRVPGSTERPIPAASTQSARSVAPCHTSTAIAL